MENKCKFCDETKDLELEPRFLYWYCKNHKDTPPVQKNVAMENEMKDIENKWESEITQGIAEEVEHECDDCLMENNDEHVKCKVCGDTGRAYPTLQEPDGVECDACINQCKAIELSDGNNVLFEDQFVLVPVAKGIDIDMFSDFYISGTGFLCARKPYMIVLYDEFIGGDGNIKTKDIVGVVKKDNKAYIKINLGE